MTISNLPAALVPPAATPPALPQRGVSPFDLDGPEGGLDWRRILTALLRFKWLIATFTLVGTVASVGATRFIKPVYSAQAKIWIDVEGRRSPDRSLAPIRPGQLLDAESWVDLLRSYVVLDQVVHDQRLFVGSAARADTQAVDRIRVADQYQPGAYRLSVDRSGQGYTLSTADGGELERCSFGDSVGTRYGLRWAPDASTVPPGHTVEFTLTTLRDAATSLADALDTWMDIDGNFLRIEMRGPDPVRITTLVNAVAQRYVTVYADLKRQKLIELTKILGEQLQHSQDNLRSAEAALQRFREETITLPGERPVTGGASVAGPVVAGAAPGTGPAGARDPLFGSFFEMQISREEARRDRDALQRLLAQQGDSGLSVEALSVVGLVQQNPELSQALTELNNKQAELRSLRYKYTDEYMPVQRLLGEIRTLQRQTIPTLARTLAGQLAGKEAELGRRSDADSRALRESPAAAVVAVVVEALRGVCLNLVYTHGAVAPLVVTITSPGAGDGKSFLAANLGHTFAEAGHRTLLIDGDLRRGVLHRRLGARRRPGVSDFLRGEVPLEAIVQATPYPSFSLIGCGTRAYNAPELLGSQTMSQLLTTLRPSYDVILVDSPPLSAGVDPLILGTLTGHLVVVLRTGFSHRDMASAKLEVLQRLPVRLLGAILNAVPAGEAYRYYSYYLPGYEAVDEEAERASGGKGQPFVI